MADKTTLNSCPGEGCHSGCIHVTHVEDGKIVRIERLQYPDGQEGTICIKGLAGARLPYLPDRLKYPLKRVGNRGEGKWERITWEQAMDEIAAKIRKIREEYSPEALVIMPGLNSQSPLDGMQHTLLGHRLMNVLQATGWSEGVATDSNPMFAAFFTTGDTLGHNQHPRALVEGNTKYIVNWGGNPAEMSIRLWKYVREARKKGAKLVDIGLIFDNTARVADWWIPVQAGSDGALALSVIDVIIKEKLFDEDYVIQYTNGPFLVRTDNGKLLRESDIFPGESAENYVVWDTVGNAPQPIAPRTAGPAELKPALLGTYQTAGIECKPVFQMLADQAGKYPPRVAEEITGVSSETIEELAREYAATRPATILVCQGLRYKNSGNAFRAIMALSAITGNVGVLGAGTMSGQTTTSSTNAPQLILNILPILFPTQSHAKSIPVTQLFQCISAGKPYPIKAMIMYGMNLLHTYPNPRRWIEEVFPNLELIVVNDIFMTATAEYADYVLPDCTVFEREDTAIGYGGEIIYLDRAIEPMYECRPGIYFWSELAKRLGFGEYFDKTIDEWIELRLKSEDPSVIGIEPPLTLERLKKEKIIQANVPKEPFALFLDKKFRTPSGRIEFYNEELLPAEDELPVFREQMESPRSTLAEKYPLVFNTANNIFFMHTMFANDPVILEKYQKEPHLSINPLDAQKRKISDGDIVIAYNDRGSCKLKALVTERVPAGVVHVPHGWSPKQFIEGHLQNLIASLASSETKDDAREILWPLTQDRVSMWGYPENCWGYAPDTTFDCLCEVKRA